MSPCFAKAPAPSQTSVISRSAGGSPPGKSISGLSMLIVASPSVASSRRKALVQPSTVRPDLRCGISASRKVMPPRSLLPPRQPTRPPTPGYQADAPLAGLTHVQAGDGPSDDHPLDLGGPLEDREARGRAGSFRR